MKEILKTAGLNKAFGMGENEVVAVRNASFSMVAGAFEAVMGPSGSGKSTFLHLIAGLISPDSGSIVVEGREIAGMPDTELTLFRRRRIGLIFQDFNLIPTLTAQENIELPLLLDGTAHEHSARIAELVSLLGLNGRTSHFPEQLSGGERQRVAVARALAGSPAIVLADEPTGNLDSPAARSLCELLRKVNKELGSSILMVSHDPVVAAAADRVHILRDGHFCASFATHGSAATVSERYLAAMV